MHVKKPIIIFGTGRSGTTIFLRMLSDHPDFAWMSALCDRYPDRLIYNKMIMKALDIAPLERLIRKRVNPAECYLFWNHYFRGFAAPSRDLVAQDVSLKVKQNLRNALAQIITERRQRLLLKITGWPRIGFLNEVFPDGKFIHVIRDGRAVANSLLNVYFWKGWHGPENWRWGPLSEAHQREWLDNGRSFAVLAAIQYKILMDAADKSFQELDSSRKLIVKYEDLCRDPISVFKEVAAFSEIEWNNQFQRRLLSHSLQNMNYKYERELNMQQQEALNISLAEYLERYGYQ